MARPKTEETVHRLNINLYQDDIDQLKVLYPDISLALIIRSLIKSHLKMKMSQLDTENFDIDLEESE